MSTTHLRCLLVIGAIVLAPATAAADNPFARPDRALAVAGQGTAGRCQPGKCQSGKCSGSDAPSSAGMPASGNGGGGMKCSSGSDGAMKCSGQGGAGPQQDRAGSDGDGAGDGGMKCGAAMGMPGMRMDMDTMVMNENPDDLPRECPQVSEEVHFTVRAGVKYAAPYPGTVFGYDEHQWKVPQCARVTVRFINDDEVRHQFMIHQLPSYLYPQGMFHLEADGGHEVTGTFIVPGIDRTYLVHCDISHHMEKGMKGQLVVGKGSGNLPSIPGLTAPLYPDPYE